MRKLLMALATVLSSVWFAPVTFVVGSGLVTASLCPLQHCQKTYTPADVASFNYAETTAKDSHEREQEFWSGKNQGLFPIAVRLPSENNEITILQLRQWSAAKLAEPGASLMLPVKNNQGSDAITVHPGVTILSNTPTSQSISVSGFHEVAALLSTSGYFEYKTDGEVVIPISSRIVLIGLFHF